jgi:hypothetical protein
MSHKLLPRLGSAIASTILSYAAVSFVGVDKAQAAVLNYTINGSYISGGSNLSFLKVDTSSLTGIGSEQIAVSEGIFYGGTLEGGKEYYNLAGKSAVFYQGDFRGLNASGSDNVIREIIIPPGEPFGPLYVKIDRRIYWRIETSPYASSVGSLFESYYDEYTTYDAGSPRQTNRNYLTNIPVSYTLVDTAPSPVPEPLTAGGTALALAGLSWLKHKKKMAA